MISIYHVEEGRYVYPLPQVPTAWAMPFLLVDQLSLSVYLEQSWSSMFVTLAARSTSLPNLLHIIKPVGVGQQFSTLAFLSERVSSWAGILD